MPFRSSISDIIPKSSASSAGTFVGEVAAESLKIGLGDWVFAVLYVLVESITYEIFVKTPMGCFLTLSCVLIDKTFKYVAFPSSSLGLDVLWELKLDLESQ